MGWGRGNKRKKWEWKKKRRDERRWGKKGRGNFEGKKEGGKKHSLVGIELLNLSLEDMYHYH